MSEAAVIVQGMLPTTCRVVVAKAVLLPRCVRGLLPATAQVDCLPEEAAPGDEKVTILANLSSGGGGGGGGGLKKPLDRKYLANGGRQKVSTTKRTRPIVKARETRQHRQDKALVASSPPPATFGADNPPELPTAVNNTTVRYCIP
jgi:hypothetical protein